MGQIHAASLESPRLKRFLEFMRRAGDRGATTREILEATGLCTVPANELRKNGVGIVCRFQHVTDTGCKVWRYWLAEFAPAEGEEIALDGGRA